MKTKYDGTKTKENLEAAFAGESQARNKYDFFASKAMSQKALELDPCSASLNLRMYRILFRERNYDEAAVYLKKTIELFPMNPKYKELKERP